MVLVAIKGNDLCSMEDCIAGTNLCDVLFLAHIMPIHLIQSSYTITEGIVDIPSAFMQLQIHTRIEIPSIHITIVVL